MEVGGPALVIFKDPAQKKCQNSRADETSTENYNKLK